MSLVCRLVYLILAMLYLQPTLPAFAETAAPMKERALVVLVFDETCKTWCVQTRPVMKDLGAEFKGEVRFAELDATPAVLEETKKTAKELGVLGVFKDVLDYVPVVLVFNQRCQLLRELVGPKSKDVYRACIEKAICPK